MIKTAPRKKAVKTEDGQVEITQEEKQPEMTDKDKKQLAAVENVIVNRNPAATGVELFNKMTRPQVELMKRTVAKGATDDELMLFLNVCVGSNLNPFLRQVHFVKRWDNRAGKEIGTIQVGIDGFRSIAESGSQYAGSDDAVFRDEREESFTINKAKVTRKIPGSATVCVYKLMAGTRYPFTATARWDEYYPGEKNGYMWHKMPYNQLSKCAEALALRKAFPKLLSGIYEPAEMDQAGPSQETKPYNTAIRLINKTTDVEQLKNAKDGIAKSTKYDDSEKIELQDAIDKRISELQGNA